MDVTALKNVEEALRGTEARLRGSLETMLDAFAVFKPVRGNDGKAVDFEVEYLNGPAHAILAAPSPADGRRLRELVPGGSPLLAILTDAVDGKAVLERQEVSDAGSAADGRIYDLRACALESGDVAVAWRDVTDRTRATRALREADRRKDEFLAVLGHELRNPIAALGTVIALEQRKADQSPSTTRHLDLMHRQVRALGRLVEDLLDVTRISRGRIHLQRRAVDLVDVVRAEFDVQQQAAGGRVRLELTAPPGPMWVSGDAERIAQITGNLIYNARKFTEAGRAVEVILRAAEEGSPELVVHDQGIGMSADTLAHLFEPFRQAEQGLDRARGGLGLGLFLVKGIAELMGARVSARSDGLGLGSEFCVRFLPDRFVAGPAAPEATAHRDARRRILVIEDNEDLRESVLEFLRDHLGHEVASAEDGEAGVARAREWRPEVVICDIGLPRIDGYRVARMLRDEPSLQGAVLVAMTGYGTGGDKARAADSGFDRHFTKPLDVEELRRFIESLPS